MEDAFLAGKAKRSLPLLMSCLFLFCGYYHVVGAKEQAIHALEQELLCLQKEKELLQTSKVALQERALSRHDPVWIEMILMQKLGLVPRGYMKVHFVPQIKGDKRSEVP